MPLARHQGLGVSIQYFRPGSLTGRDQFDQLTGDFGGYSMAGSLAYGLGVTETLALGANLKAIRSKIDDLSASAWAGGFGAMYRPFKDWSFGAAVDNVGSKLKFIQQEDPLPRVARLGAAYIWQRKITGTVEGSFERGVSPSPHAGIEYTSREGVSLRTGFNGDYRHGLTGIAGWSLGLGFKFTSAEIAYSWVPLNDLGQSHLFSIQYRFGAGEADENSTDMEHIENEKWNSDFDLMKDFSNE
jgi:hypothetical protein